MMETGTMTKKRGDTAEGIRSTEIIEGISMKNSNMMEKMIADTEIHVLEKVIKQNKSQEEAKTKMMTIF